MFRLLLISLILAILVACSSDDSNALHEWFGDKNIAVSYEKQFKEFDISLKEAPVLGSDTSAFIVNPGFCAALGSVNGVEHTLYFELFSPLTPKDWTLKADSLFYAESIGGQIPEEQLNATIYWYWLKKEETEPDSTWLKFITKNDSSANINIEWANDEFLIPLQDKLPNGFKGTVKLELNSNNTVLRIVPHDTAGISGLRRVAQKIRVLDDECKQCLHAGARESLSVFFEMADIKNFDKTVVFAQLILPKSNDEANKNELENFPIPIYVYGENYYRIDSASVIDGHPNFAFGKSDTLKLEVTNSLRKDTLGFTLRLGNPVLQPDSLYFYRHIAARPTYSRYNFGSILNEAKLRIWFADYGDKK